MIDENRHDSLLAQIAKIYLSISIVIQRNVPRRNCLSPSENTRLIMSLSGGHRRRKNRQQLPIRTICAPSAPSLCGHILGWVSWDRVGADWWCTIEWRPYRSSSFRPLFPLIHSRAVKHACGFGTAGFPSGWLRSSFSRSNLGLHLVFFKVRFIFGKVQLNGDHINRCVYAPTERERTLEYRWRYLSEKRTFLASFSTRRTPQISARFRNRQRGSTGLSLSDGTRWGRACCLRQSPSLSNPPHRIRSNWKK